MTDSINADKNNSSASRVGALDLGEKRIGVAISDDTQTIARSYTVFERSSRKADFEKIETIIEENHIKLIIVGLPTLSSGKEGSKAKWARDYANDLEARGKVKVELWDESFSTVDAQNSLRERKINRGRRQKQIDAVAAAFILQSYLDARDET